MRLTKPMDLIEQLVQILYCGESQLILALPRIAVRANDPDLRTALQQHLKQTRDHAARLEELADLLEIDCVGRKCHAIAGLLKEGEESMGNGGDETMIDAAIVAACLSVERYEITQYEALQDLLENASMTEGVGAIKQTLADEQGATESLERVFESLTNDMLQSPAQT